MCAYMVPGEQAEVSAIRARYDAAYDRFLSAIKAQHNLVISLDEGATSSELARPGLCDIRLRDNVRSVFEASYAYEQAAHDLMMSEPHRGKITSLSLAIAMQIRASRNDKAARIPGSSSRLPAVASVGGL